MRPINVVILAYPQLCTFEFGIAAELFSLSRPEEPQWYSTKVVAEAPGPMAATSGISVVAPHGLECIDALCAGDLIVVPGWTTETNALSVELRNKLVTANARGVRLASICSGVFVLAEAGLLNGGEATTHWRYAEILNDRFPEVSVLANVLFVEYESILTSAGSAAGLDLGLHIIAQDFGEAAARRTAKRLVLPRRREGGQSQFAQSAGASPAGSLAGLFECIESELGADWTLQTMAQACGTSERTLARRFRDETDMTPLEWLRHARIRRSCELLESTGDPIGMIAHQSGFGSEEAMRLHFRRIVGIAPTRYRNNFKAQ